MGILATERNIRAADEANVGLLIARTFPGALPRALQLLTDLTLVFCILDDHIEQLGTATDAAAYLGHLLDQLHGRGEPCCDEPFARALLDLRERTLAIAPPHDVAHVVDRITDLFVGWVTEAHNREHAQVPDLASYSELRRVTIGLPLIWSLAEAAGVFHLPDAVREHGALRRLATRTSHIVGWENDLFTYQKEIPQGEVHNLVRVLMHERRLGLTEAAEAAAALHDLDVRRLQQEIAQLPSFGAADPAVQRYVDILTSWIRGHLDWAHQTGRYVERHLFAVSSDDKHRFARLDGDILTRK